MPADLTELFENASAPPMFVDAERVLARGRRRRLRRRLGGSMAVLAATALVVPTAVVLRTDADPASAPAVSPPSDCLYAGQGVDGQAGGIAEGMDLNGTRWLDSGASGAGRDVRVQVYTDTCNGLAVAVTRGTSGGSRSVSTADLKGRPDHAFWVVDTVGGDVDRFGNVVPAKSLAAVLLPDGQRVCDGSTESVPSDPSATPLPLSTRVTVPAGDGWIATFGGLPSGGNPESAALRICEGDRVVSAALRPMGSPVPTTATVDEDTGFIVLPLDAYWYSQQENQDLASAVGVAMIQCKRSKGVVSVDELGRVIPDPPDRPFGVWRMSEARQYGYLEPMSQAKRDAIAENGDPSFTISAAEMAAGEQCVHEDPILRVLNEQPEDGPWATAVSTADEAARSSQAWDDVVDDWARCLEDQGVPVNREDMMPKGVDSRALDEGRVRAEEVALAVADVTCKQRTDYVQRLTNVVAAAQAPWIEKYKTRYQEQRAAIDKQLVLARQVLKDAGL